MKPTPVIFASQLKLTLKPGGFNAETHKKSHQLYFYPDMLKKELLIS